MRADPPAPIAGNGERILVVEDEPAFAELIALWLERHGWRPEIAPDGAHALRSVAEHPPDLIILDLGLPRVDGWHVIERVREESLVPIIIVTARGSEADKVRGLAIGADDYVTKPLSFPELVARVAAALRRARAVPAMPAATATIERPGLLIDGRSHHVLVAGSPVHLTPTEYRLLRHFAERDGVLVSHADLLVAVWGPGYRDDHHLLRVAIRNLRAKLAAAAPGHRFVETAYGLGYRFSASGGVAGEDVGGEDVGGG